MVVQKPFLHRWRAQEHSISKAQKIFFVIQFQAFDGQNHGQVNEQTDVKVDIVMSTSCLKSTIAHLDDAQES